MGEVKKYVEEQLKITIAKYHGWNLDSVLNRDIQDLKDRVYQENIAWFKCKDICEHFFNEMSLHDLSTDYFKYCVKELRSI